MHPDFLIIPYVIINNERLKPSDWALYGAIYFSQHLSVGKCIASNKSVADIARIKISTVQHGLDRLEKDGYIQRVFKDAKSRCPAGTVVSEYGLYVAYDPGGDEPAGTQPRRSAHQLGGGTKIDTRGSGPTSRVPCPWPVRSSAMRMSPGPSRRTVPSPISMSTAPDSVNTA